MASMSLAYSVVLLIIGLGVAGLFYLFLDQILDIELASFKSDYSVSGDYLDSLNFMWGWIPVAFVIAGFIGLVGVSIHKRQ
jgi:hypothetical protein